MKPANDETQVLPSDLGRHPNDGWVMADPWPMSEGTRRALRAIITALCPPPPAPVMEGMVDLVEDHIRRILRYMQPLTAYGFVVAVHLVTWAPLWMLRGRRPLTRISAAQGAALLSTMSHSTIAPVRMLVVAVRGMVLSTWFDQDAVHRALDYAPQPFMVARVQLRKRILAGGASLPSDVLPSRGAA